MANDKPVGNGLLGEGELRPTVAVTAIVHPLQPQAGNRSTPKKKIVHIESE